MSNYWEDNLTEDIVENLLTNLRILDAVRTGTVCPKYDVIVVLADIALIYEE